MFLFPIILAFCFFLLDSNITLISFYSEWVIGSLHFPSLVPASSSLIHHLLQSSNSPVSHCCHRFFPLYSLHHYFISLFHHLLDYRPKRQLPPSVCLYLSLPLPPLLPSTLSSSGQKSKMLDSSHLFTIESITNSFRNIPILEINSWFHKIHFIPMMFEFL